MYSVSIVETRVEVFSRTRNAVVKRADTRVFPQLLNEKQQALPNKDLSLSLQGKPSACK